jgi:hypothetical protein
MKTQVLSVCLVLTGNVVMAQEYPQHLAISQSVVAGVVSEQKAEETIRASNAVNQGATALYKAGQSVTLQPGFVAQAGSVFMAIVAPLNSVKTAADLLGLSVRAYPNPFVEQATIDYNLPTSGRVRHTLLNEKGQVVRQIENVMEQPVGRHQARVEGADLPIGIYLYRIEQGTESRTLRLLKKE